MAHFSTELLVNLAAAQLAIDPDTTAISALDMGGLSQSFTVQSNRGRFILQIGPADDAPQLFYQKGGMKQLPELHALIRARTTIPAPEVVAHDFSRSLIDRDYLILEAKAGVPFGQVAELDHKKYNRVLWQLGDMLRQLHAITGRWYGYDGLHRPLGPHPTWRQAFDAMWRRSVADVVRTGLYSAAEALLLARLWEAYNHYFDQDAPPVLLRMDMGEDHFLVDRAATLTAALGFEHAMWGHPELDFAVLDYAGIYASSFWEGYGRARPNDPGSQLRRRFYLMYEIQKHILISVWHDNDMAGAEQAAQMAMAIAKNTHL